MKGDTEKGEALVFLFLLIKIWRTHNSPFSSFVFPFVKTAISPRIGLFKQVPVGFIHCREGRKFPSQRHHIHVTYSWSWMEGQTDSIWFDSIGDCTYMLHFSWKNTPKKGSAIIWSHSLCGSKFQDLSFKTKRKKTTRKCYLLRSNVVGFRDINWAK
jgi:hypothetical protein